jgi:hypothetical protein
MVVEDFRTRTWTHPLREHRDVLLGGCCGEMMELEGREPTINTLLHLSRHPNGIHETEEFRFYVHQNLVRRNDIM